MEEAARQTHARLPIAVISSFSTTANAIEVANVGVADYLLTKPFKVPKVLKAVIRALIE